MATYVMSDLHGCEKEFKELLAKIAFSEKDQLYIIGDVVDRGRHSIRLLQYIREAKNITLILGNHELMMREALVSNEFDLWFYNGGMTTLKEFEKLTVTEQNSLLDYLYSLPLFLDITVTDRHYRLIHGAPQKEEDDIENSGWERPQP